MEYSFISDPELRGKLEKARKKNRTFDSINKDPIEKEESNSNQNLLKKKKSKPNKKFESLKAKKKNNRKKRLKPPSTKALAVATKQLSSMIRTGLPLLEALNILSESNEDKTLKAVFKEASIGISRGATFQEILEKHPDIFDDMYLALVSAGEAAGLLCAAPIEHVPPPARLDSPLPPLTARRHRASRAEGLEQVGISPTVWARIRPADGGRERTPNREPCRRGLRLAGQ